MSLEAWEPLAPGGTATRTLRDQLIESASPEPSSMAFNLISVSDSLPRPDTLHSQIILLQNLCLGAKATLKFVPFRCDR